MQAPRYAAAGAEVTVVDISPEMLEQDRRVARERGLELHTIAASMDDLPMLANASFDLVTQPVSTCYVPSLAKVYAEIARVLRIGGQYLSQHKQPATLQAAPTPFPSGYAVTEDYYAKGPVPPLHGEFEHREKGAFEFVHRWEEIVGGLCRSGFVIEAEARRPRRRAGDVSAPQPVHPAVRRHQGPACRQPGAWPSGGRHRRSVNLLGRATSQR